jgi:hypothetical protein
VDGLKWYLGLDEFVDDLKCYFVYEWVCGWFGMVPCVWMWVCGLFLLE